MPQNRSDSSLISFVIPCHNEGPNIDVLTGELTRIFPAGGRPIEIIFVDDSTDDTPLRIARLHEGDQRVKMRRLTRSFGQSQAIFSGLQVARGEAVIIMDADLEDPPDLLPDLLRHWQGGFDVVGVRRSRQQVGLIYHLCARLFYFVMNRVLRTSIPERVGEFRLLDQRVVRLLNKLPENPKFFRGLSVWPGYKTKIVDASRRPRGAGRSTYGFWRSFGIALDGLLAFSYAPLRLIAIVGFVLSVLTGLMAIAYFIWRMVNPSIFGVGWASLFLAILLSLAVNLLFLGIVAEYVGRIFYQVQGRPSYIVDFDLGIESPDVSAE